MTARNPFLTILLLTIAFNLGVSNRSAAAEPVPTYAVQFIRSNAAKWNIDSQRIAAESTAAGRYVKVFCKNNGLLPAWHKAPGVLGHLMMDGILVNPTEANQ